MDFGKLSSQPPLVAAFCLCALFVFMHYLSAPSEPQGFGPEVAVANAYVPTVAQTPKVSFLAVANGVVVDDNAKQAKEEVKREQKLIKKEESMATKIEKHITSEENTLKKEKKLLEQEEAASKSGNQEKYRKLSKKLDKLVKAEVRDASIAGKTATDQRKHAAELAAMFDNWASSVKHPGSKWGGKHSHAVAEQRKVEKTFEARMHRGERVEAAQAKFLEKRRAFEQGRAPGQML